MHLMNLMNQYCAWENELNQHTNSDDNFYHGQWFEEKRSRCIPKTERDSIILQGYQFKFRYEYNLGRRKKIICCQYDDCEKEFTKTWSFLYHARSHEGEKPFECGVCRRQFSQKSNLTKHMRHHVLKTVKDRKLFRCHLCPKGYTERYNLRVRYHWFIVQISKDDFKYHMLLKCLAYY